MFSSNLRSTGAAVIGAAMLLGAGTSAGSINNRDIVRNVVPRDAIPSLVLPPFVAVKDADFMRDADRVIAVDVGADDRAYPIRILEHHEIVNDVVGGRPLIITY